jgi:hypothetical protein
MFYDVGDVSASTVDASLFKRLGQESTCRPDERVTRKILVVAGLLANEHHVGGGASLTEHRLSRAAPEKAGTAPASSGG